MEQHQNWLLWLNDRNLEFCLVELLAGGLCVLSGLFKLGTLPFNSKCESGLGMVI